MIWSSPLLEATAHDRVDFTRIAIPNEMQLFYRSACLASIMRQQDKNLGESKILNMDCVELSAFPRRHLSSKRFDREEVQP